MKILKCKRIHGKKIKLMYNDDITLSKQHVTKSNYVVTQFDINTDDLEEGRGFVSHQEAEEFYINLIIKIESEVK